MIVKTTIDFQMNTIQNINFNRLIITAASRAYAPSLLALLGSLTLNWPNHPPVLVYDIGLDSSTLTMLRQHNILVKKVPPFCPHWREHYTWKIWCLNDAPARDILWLDAGLVVLQTLDEIFDTLEHQGYFLSTNYELLDWEASEAACEGCGVPTVFRKGKLVLPAGLMGFRKAGKILNLLEEALSIALTEKYIAATNVAHRYEQAIISLLMYKFFHRVNIFDGIVYLGGKSPQQIPGQKVWVHRRGICERDIEHFTAHISTPGDAYMPTPPHSRVRAQSRDHLYRVYWYFGRGEIEEALFNLDLAFRIDPSLTDEVSYLVNWLEGSQHRIQTLPLSDSFDFDFISWVFKFLPTIGDRSFVWKLRKVYSHVYCTKAFEYHQSGDLQKVRQMAIRSLLYNPALLVRNRGLLSILLESFFGSFLMGQLRLLKARLLRYPHI